MAVVADRACVVGRARALRLVDVVEAALVDDERADDAPEPVDAEAARLGAEEVVGRDAKADDGVAADAGAHAGDHAAREREAVVPGPLVAAVVPPRAPRLLQQVAVRPVQLDAVEPG